MTNSVTARLTDLLSIHSKFLPASCPDHLQHQLPDIHGVQCSKHPMWGVAFSIWTKERSEVTYEGHACFYWAPWPYFSEFPYENQWVSGQYSQLSDYFLKNEIRLKNAQDMYEYKNVRKMAFFSAKNQEILKMSHFYLNELSLTIRTGFLWVNVTIWHWVCSNIPKIKDFRGYHPSFGNNVIFSPFLQKVNFLFCLLWL